MRYDNYLRISAEIRDLMRRYFADIRRLEDELAQLVIKAYKEGEREGQRQATK